MDAAKFFASASGWEGRTLRFQYSETLVSRSWFSLSGERPLIVFDFSNAFFMEHVFHARFSMVRLTVLLVALFSLKGLSPAAEVSRSQPNIVIFITDDESW